MYEKIETKGTLTTDGIFIASDGKQWKSVGCIDYGNNNFYEVMVPVAATTEDLPVFMKDHNDDDLEELGQPLPQFLSDILMDAEQHTTDVVMQLGLLLANHTGRRFS